MSPPADSPGKPLTVAAGAGDAGPDAAERFRVIVAGGGVAALEAVLALEDLGGRRLEIELVSPVDTFALEALSVAEPFGTGPPRTLDLAEFCSSHGATFRPDTVAEVWGEQQRVLMGSGEEVYFDALLLAIGARRRDAISGALVFRGSPDVASFGDLLDDLDRGAARSLTFAVPDRIRWTLPLYELALLTAARLTAAGIEADLRFVTPESAPLDVFGPEVAGEIATLLAEAGVELIPSTIPVSFNDDRLLCESGRGIPTHHVVTLPALSVPDIPGLPQGRYGLIHCDPEMRVDGLTSVWVAGDASWMPIKQGGLAAQQAEIAAAGIAAAAGADVEPEPFRPVIRAALLTGREPRFLRLDSPSGATGELSRSPLWWPPIKVAGPRLAPFLAAEWAGEGDEPLPMEDLSAGEPDTREEREREHREAIRVALRFADMDAADGEFAEALRWLDVAERLNVTLPAPYDERRASWSHKVGRWSSSSYGRPAPPAEPPAA